MYELCLNITRSCFSLLYKSCSYHLHLSLSAPTIQKKTKCKEVDGLYEKQITFSHTLVQEWTVLLAVPCPQSVMVVIKTRVMNFLLNIFFLNF